MQYSQVFSSDYNIPFFHLLSKLTQEQIPSHVKGTYKERRGGKHTCQLRREQKQCMPQRLCAAQYMKIFDQSSYNTEHPQSLSCDAQQDVLLMRSTHLNV